MQVPLAVLLPSFDSVTWLAESTMIRKEQSGAKQPPGMGKSRLAEPPAGIGGVGWENVPPDENPTVVLAGPASALPWFFTVTIRFPRLSILQNPVFGSAKGMRSGSPARAT